MPRLSDSMEEGTVLRWMKGIGDSVEVGEELVEIETDKANMVYESDSAGTLVEILAQEGDTLEVGDPIARVGDASEVVGGNGGGAGAASPGGAGAQPQKSRAPITGLGWRKAPWSHRPDHAAGPRDHHPRPFPSRGWWRRPRQGVSHRQADRPRSRARSPP